jgi:hypothetical protein
LKLNLNCEAIIHAASLKNDYTIDPASATSKNIKKENVILNNSKSKIMKQDFIMDKTYMHFLLFHSQRGGYLCFFILKK